MSFIASASAMGAAALSSVMAAGTLGLTAGAISATGAALGGGLAAGAIGAGLGAGTAALTGGDVGKGALMGGVGGAVTGGLASGIGAAGGTAGMFGSGVNAGGAGATGGGIGNVGTSAVTTPLAEQSTISATPFFDEGLSSATNVAPMRLAELAPAATATEVPLSSAEIGSALSTPVNATPALGGGTYASNVEAINAVNNIPSAPLKASDYVDKGINFIKKNPAVAMQLGGAGLSMMGGNPNQQKAPASQAYPYSPSTYVPPAIQPTTVPQYYDPTGSYGYGAGYAEGGAVNNGQPNGQINPIVAKAMQQGTALAQVQQSQLPQQPPQPPAPQGIAAVPPPVQQPVPPPIQQAQPTQMAAGGGMMRDNLGGYSHGGIAGLTRGPGDGVSDSIPAEIGTSGKQPARLADGEFVIPARIVSELGNGSTEAGAKSLQAMVDRVQARRGKTVGKGKVAVDSKARKGLLA